MKKFGEEQMRMKKTLANIMLVLAICLVGCSDVDSESDEYKSKIFELSEKKSNWLQNQHRNM